MHRPKVSMNLAAGVAIALLSAACSESVTAPGAAASRLHLSQSNSQGNSQSSSSSSSFTVLGRAAVSCTDGTILGDVGTFQTYPPGAITLVRCPITGGTAQVGTRAAQDAYNAFLNTYAALAPQTGDCDAAHTLPSTITGPLTLAPGVYCTNAALTLAGVLTLDGPANGTWLFKIGTLGTGALTGTTFSVVMGGLASACNVTWWVAQDATFTTSGFQGNILAGAAITVTGGPLNGNMWAGAAGVGDVTFTGSAVTGCPGSTVPGPGNGNGKGSKCNQGVGNGPEQICDPGNSNNHNSSNDENGGTPGNPGRQGSKKP